VVGLLSTHHARRPRAISTTSTANSLVRIPDAGDDRPY
jgi:hypothetical protein